MASSLATALSGIRSHQFLLDVIGNNLANVDTVGFKASRVQFSELMNQTLREARAPGSSIGGINPVQVGLGVGVGSVTRDFQQGGLTDTGNPLDLAMDGDGFVVLNDGTRRVYVRSGTFNVDADEYLVEAGTGYRVQDSDGEDLDIPYSTRLPGQASAEVEVSGNLTAGADEPLSEEIETSEVFQEGGAAATAATALGDLDSTSVAYSDGDVIRITGKKPDGTSLTPLDFVYGAGNDGTTLGDLRDKITEAYEGAATATIDSDGNVVVASDEPGDASMTLALENQSGTGQTDFAGHSFYEAQAGVDGGTHRTSIRVYDSQGQGHVLTLTFTKAGQNEWNLDASIDDSEGTVVDGKIEAIRFNTDGSYASVAGTDEGDSGIAVRFNGIDDTQEININFGTAGQFDGLTQFGGQSAAAATSQDGYSAGDLDSISIQSDGTVQGLYTNGERRDLAQIQVATFDNPAGLSNMGKNMWTETAGSGSPILGTALSGRAGAIAGSTLEGSNVESASELAQLIIAQRGYQLSARTMSVSDRVLQEVVNVVR